MSILEYASPEPEPPRWREVLYSLRFVLLTLYIAMLVGGITWCIWADMDWIIVALATLILFGLQAFFLVGCPEIRWPRPKRRASARSSIVIGALMASLLTFGIFASVLNISSAWENLTDRIGGHIFWVMLFGWIVWTMVFSLMYLGHWFLGFSRLYRLLIAGTGLELLITIPIDVHVRRRTSCYCGEGTFFALLLGTTAALWSFGPGLVLLFLTRRLQREGYFALCQKCGADLSGWNDKRCPVCKARIARNNRQMA